MKITLFIFGVLALTNFHHVLAQRSYQANQAEAPTQLSVLNFQERVTNSVYLLWLGSNNVLSYTIRIYRRSDDALYKKIRNVIPTIKNVTGLGSGERYYSTVSAVYPGSNGQEIESPESDRAYFKTDEECTNGKVFLSCSAHCVSTCEDPDPICSRVCTPGCGCPYAEPIWHEGRCVVRSSCPASTNGGPMKPQNIQVLRGIGNSRFLAWDPVINAQSYAVKVRVAESTELVQTHQTVIPIVAIQNLMAGVTYEFAVQITPEKPQSVLSSDVLAPPRIIYARDITDNSFLVRWIAQSKAASYALVLYDRNQSKLLSATKNISGNSITVDNLAPGVSYHIAVASASASGQHGPFSTLREVTTTGNPVNTENFYSAILVDTPIMATTTPPATTPTPTVTRCRQLYASVRNFYLEYPGVNGPSYPDCDADGMFVTRKCDSTTPPRECWCINGVNGKKIAGSKFGNGNSDFELDCDHYGNLVADDLEMEATNLTSTSVELEWNKIDGVRGYVLMVDNKIRSSKTISVEGASSTRYELSNLRPGHTIEVGIYAVDMQGRSSPMTNMEVSTSLLNRPQDLEVRELTPSSLQLSWSHSVNADGASVKIISRDTNEVLRSFKVSSDNVIITDLESSRYTIEVREIRCDYVCDNPQATILHTSEPTSVQASLACNIPILDLIFVFDVSPQSGLRTQKRIAREITQRVPELNRQTGTRIAAIKYYQHASTLFSYNRFNDASTLIDRIENINSSDTQSNPTFMLNYVRTRFFNPRRSDAYKKRSNAVTAVIVFSGNSSALPPIGLSQAASLLKAETKVIAIGTTPRSDDAILSQIASNSDVKLTVSSSDDLGAIAGNLTQRFCNF